MAVVPGCVVGDEENFPPWRFNIIGIQFTKSFKEEVHIHPRLLAILVIHVGFIGC